MQFTDKTIKAVHTLSTSNLRASLYSRLRECKIQRCSSDATAALSRLHVLINRQKHHTSTKKKHS